MGPKNLIFRGPCYRPPVRPTWLVLVVLLACAIQTTEALTLLLPDDCTTVAGASGEDDCQAACARCLCCARRAPSDAARTADVPLERRAAAIIPLESRAAADTPPRDVFHVPKSLR